MKDDGLYLDHIIECIVRVRRYTEGGREAFMADELIQDAVIRNLQVMTESTQRLSPETKGRHGEIDWSQIAGFRNRVVHRYLDIRLDRIWDIIETKLDPLDEVAKQELRDLDERQRQTSEGGEP